MALRPLIVATWLFFLAVGCSSKSPSGEKLAESRDAHTQPPAPAPREPSPDEDESRTPAAADAGSKPSTLDAWQEAIARGYAHYKSIDAEVAPAERCERVRRVAEPNELRVVLSPEDRKVFSPLWIRVARRAGAEDTYEAFLGVGVMAPDFCVSKRSELVLTWADWLLQLEVPCSAGQLVHYEIGDFIAFLDGVLGRAGRPKDALLSLCGSMKLDRVSLDELMQRASEARNLWGKEYPARRTDARGASK